MMLQAMQLISLCGLSSTLSACNGYVPNSVHGSSTTESTSESKRWRYSEALDLATETFKPLYTHTVCLTYSKVFKWRVFSDPKPFAFPNITFRMSQLSVAQRNGTTSQATTSQATVHTRLVSVTYTAISQMCFGILPILLLSYLDAINIDKDH